MAVGIDIGTKSIKIVELEKSGNVHELRGSGVIGFKGKNLEAIEDEKELGQLAAIIRRLHKEAGITKKEVHVSLPENKVFTRTIRFPMLTDQEIESAVKWESEQYIPIPIDEAIVQHQIIERREKATPPEVVVLLVAVQQTFVEKYVKLIQMAGLSPIVFESEMLALTRALSTENQTDIVVDFGSVNTDLAVVRNLNLVFSRSIPIAGDALTRAVAQGIGVEISQAEEYKKTYGLSPNQLEGKVVGVIQPVVRSIIDEIKKAMHYYQTEEKGELPKRIIFTGGSVGLPGFSSMVIKELGLEVVIGNPFTKVKLPQDVAAKISGYAPLYAISAGLAMRD